MFVAVFFNPGPGDLTVKKISSVIFVGIMLAAVGSSFAQQAMKPEEAIKVRQSGYEYMAWNMHRIKASLDGQYNKDEVVQAANVIQAIANSSMGKLYLPGTDKGKGWENTRVKPELFKDKEGVTKVGKAFNDAANEMARVATTGDAVVVKAAFDKLGKTCKGCHDDYRVKD
jgi:cytochrome c556